MWLVVDKKTMKDEIDVTAASRRRFEVAKVAVDAADMRISDEIQATALMLNAAGVGLSFPCSWPFQAETPVWYGKYDGVWCFYGERHQVLSMPRHTRLAFWKWLKTADLFALAADAYEAALLERLP